MRSISGRAVVKQSSGQIKLAWNGTPIRVDLDTCSLSPSGTLVLTPTRNGTDGRFDWSLTAQIDGAGLIEAKQGAALIAPSDGYRSFWKCGYSSTDNRWRFAHDSDVFYQLRGKYGRLKLQIYADAAPSDVSVYLSRFLNEAGGRETE